MVGFIAQSDTVHDYTLKFTVTHISDHSHAFTSRCWVAASNGRHSPSYRFTFENLQ
jgi:hypothetical protein